MFIKLLTFSGNDFRNKYFLIFEHLLILYSLRHWDAAEDACQRLFPPIVPHLASIHSDGEMKEISYMLQLNNINTFTWFGLQIRM